jgi:Flp pilus assembly protein TadB
MTPDQQAGSDHERQDERADAEREADSDAERDEGRDEAEGREEGGGEDEGSLRQDMKDLPGEMREDAGRVYRGADENIAQRMEEKPAFERALDLRIVAAALVIAFVIALVLRLIGLPPLFAILIFLIALGGLWVGLARYYATRRSRSAAGSERREREREDEEGDDGEEDG